MLKKLLPLVLVSCLALTLLSCGDAANPPATQPGPDDQTTQASDEAAIYAEVVRRLATVDDTFGGNLHPKTLYIIGVTDDKAGDPTGQTSAGPKAISESVRNDISVRLADLGAEIVWIEQFDDAEFESFGSAVNDGGAIFTLGSIHEQDDGSVQVAGSIYIANLAAGGTTYVLEKQEGIWRITGQTGASWIS